MPGSRLNTLKALAAALIGPPGEERQRTAMAAGHARVYEAPLPGYDFRPVLPRIYAAAVGY